MVGNIRIFKMKKVNVLLSSVDAGAAQNIVHLVNILKEINNYHYEIYACDAAADIFIKNNIDFKYFNHLPVDRSNPTQIELSDLKNEATNIINLEKPDLVINGLSNNGNGLDEALPAAARISNYLITTIVLLDDQGPLYSLDGCMPDHILATTIANKNWAEKTVSSRVHLIGSLKHHALSLMPVDDIRINARRKFNMRNEEDKLITFISQSERHNKVFNNLLNVLGNIHDELPEFKLIVRIHPGAREAGEKCYSLARKMNINVQSDYDSNLNELLCSSDVLLSCNSTVLADYVWLALGGDTLRTVPVYMLCDDQVRDWLVERHGSLQTDIIKHGLALVANNDSDLKSYIIKLLNKKIIMKSEDKEKVRDISDPVVAIKSTLQNIVENTALN
jgi:hypothetical protein